MLVTIELRQDFVKLVIYKDSIMAKTTTAKRSYKLDIMHLLEAIDLKEKDFYANLTDEEKKGFAPVVTIRWLSTLVDTNKNRDWYLLAVNNLVNCGLWDLKDHPELVYLLMTVCGVGSKQRHQWIARKQTRASKMPKFEAMLKSMDPLASDQEILILASQYNIDEAVDLAKRSGFTDNAIKEIKDEFKKATGG